MLLGMSPIIPPTILNIPTVSEVIKAKFQKFHTSLLPP
jgi:hypothetical protein